MDSLYSGHLYKADSFILRQKCPLHRDSIVASEKTRWIQSKILVLMEGWRGARKQTRAKKGEGDQNVPILSERTFWMSHGCSGFCTYSSLSCCYTYKLQMYTHFCDFPFKQTCITSQVNRRVKAFTLTFHTYFSQGCSNVSENRMKKVWKGIFS